MKRLITLLTLFVLAACGAAPVAIETPTNIVPPTQISLDKIPIEPAVIQSGDLPSGISGGQVKEIMPILFKDITPPVRVLTQSLDSRGAPLGNVTVLLYATPKERNAAYGQMLSAIAVTSSTGGAVQPGIGEQSFGGVFTNNLAGFAEIVFERCHATVHIRLSTTDVTDVTSYAKRLDTRLTPIVCWSLSLSTLTATNEATLSNSAC